MVRSDVMLIIELSLSFRVIVVKFCIPEGQISTELVRRKSLVIHGIRSVQYETRSVITLHREV